jgi:hypothetical protein
MGSGTRFLLAKNIIVTARQRYTEHKTPNAEEYLRALIDRGSDIGNRMPNYINFRFISYREDCSPKFLTPLSTHYEGIQVRSEYQNNLWDCSFNLSNIID